MNNQTALLARPIPRPALNLQGAWTIRGKKLLGLLTGLAVAFWLSQMPAIEPLDENGVRFLATLAAAVTLWVFEVFDEYVVGLLLLFSWLLLDIVPPETALAGFSKSSWIFALSALGIGAGVQESGLLRRGACYLLRVLPGSYRTYRLTTLAVGPFLTALLPEVKARVVIVMPLISTLSERFELRADSNHTAGLTLASYVGLTQATFMFLTGSTYCLVGWALLPDWAKAEFGWLTWSLAALPAGLFMLAFLHLANCFLFRAQTEAKPLNMREATIGIECPDRMTQAEWISLIVVTMALTGWLSKPLHGIEEAWIAFGGFLAFLATGGLDRKALKNKIDWGIILFFGVIYGIGGVCLYLKVDRWLLELLAPMASLLFQHRLAFLVTVLLSVYLVRFFLVKAPAVILAILVFMPWADQAGIHPGVLLLTILLGIESWFFPYQNPSYLLAYQRTGGEAFSHAEARKLMVVKFVASFMALLISIPYWMMLGLIH